MSEPLSIEQKIASWNVQTQKACQRCGAAYLGAAWCHYCETCEPIALAELETKQREQQESRELEARIERHNQTYREQWPERHRQKVEEMSGPGLEKAKALMPVIERGAMLVLFGDRGRGKTQIATWIACNLAQKGRTPGYYLKAFDLFVEIKSTWAKGSEQSEKDVSDYYKNVAYLAVDEAHERGETDWENRTMRNILDHRYDSCLPTIIIGNWQTPEQIRESLGASIADRITETGGLVWCNWESYRAP